MTPTLESLRTGRPRTVLAALALAVSAVVAVAGCAASGHHSVGSGAGVHLAAHRSAATEHRTFVPYDSQGALTVAVTRRTTGTCWLTSLADPTATAYRCFAGNQILDPCFAHGATAKGDTVACVADPWSKATVLTLKKALPAATPGRARIWAFTRADGAHCVAATGTVPAVAGRNLQFNCSDGTFASLNDVHHRRVEAVYAKATATSLSKAFVQAVWTS